MQSRITYESILEGTPPDRLFWTPELTEGFAVEADTRKASKPFASRNEPWLLTEFDGVEFVHARESDTDLFRWRTPVGTLTARRTSNHMTEYPLKSLEDVPVWRYVNEHTVHRRNPAFTEADGAACRKMGFKWSPVQELLQFETGVENFYYFLADAPDEMTALMEAMHRRNVEALEIGLAACTGAGVFQLTENTSASLISPQYYRRYSVPHICRYVEMAHRCGKRVIVHMCGLLSALLDAFPETGIDGIHAVTPPPVGDTHYVTVRQRYGDGFAVVGRLNAQLWLGKPPEQTLALLKNMIPPTLVRTPFALWISTDEMQPAVADIANLRAALEQYNHDL